MWTINQSSTLSHSPNFCLTSSEWTPCSRRPAARTQLEGLTHKPFDLKRNRRCVELDLRRPDDARSVFNANSRREASYVCVADVQDHKAELAVLVLVQLVDQLSVVSLQQKRTHRKSYTFLPSITRLRCSQGDWAWPTDHMGLLGGFGHSVSSLTVISVKIRGHVISTCTF